MQREIKSEAYFRVSAMEVVRMNLGKSSHNMGTVVDFAGSERDSVAF